MLYYPYLPFIKSLPNIIDDSHLMDASHHQRRHEFRVSIFGESAIDLAISGTAGRSKGQKTSRLPEATKCMDGEL